MLGFCCVESVASGFTPKFCCGESSASWFMHRFCSLGTCTKILPLPEFVISRFETNFSWGNHARHLPKFTLRLEFCATPQILCRNYFEICASTFQLFPWKFYSNVVAIILNLCQHFPVISSEILLQCVPRSWPRIILCNLGML
jgi:hypothetical protein